MLDAYSQARAAGFTPQEAANIAEVQKNTGIEASKLIQDWRANNPQPRPGVPLKDYAYNQRELRKSRRKPNPDAGFNKAITLALFLGLGGIATMCAGPIFVGIAMTAVGAAIALIAGKVHYGKQ